MFSLMFHKNTATPSRSLSRQQHVRLAWREDEHLCYGQVTEHISHTQQNSVYWLWLKFSFPHFLFLCQVIPQRVYGLYAVTSVLDVIVWKPSPYGFSTTGLHFFYVLARPQKAHQCTAKEAMVQCFKALRIPSFTISEEACKHLSTN